MIKLDLPDRPAKLTDTLVGELTQEYFDNTSKAVWNKKWLKKAVLTASFEKCCYSEIRLNEESKYMEMDHFFPKSLFPEKVVEWGNLFPSCKKCNDCKGEHNVDMYPIINPFTDYPSDFLYIKAYRFYGKDAAGIGKRTIEVLALNDRQHFVDKRSKIGLQLAERLKDLRDEIEDKYRLPRCLQKLKGLMRTGNRREEYSALVSTVILSDENYKFIESYLLKNNLWDEELSAEKAELEFCALP